MQLEFPICDPVALRYLTLRRDSVNLSAEEERSLDGEIDHIVKDVSVFFAE
ncbi:MAG: hypothetical protein JRH16_20825 [Deltaproteobacteria bacterium]|nr:hypothetical protein [Deltaproteobacteria bacterium]